MAGEDWTRSQLIVAFNLYCKTPFGKINASNVNLQNIAPLIGRSANALAMKLANFARLDPDLQARGIKGLKGGSKGEEEIWNEFNHDSQNLAFESEKFLAKYKGEKLEESTEIETSDLPKEGKERQALVKIRVNQKFFRESILASYNNTCCITGLQKPELLVAGHIKKWSEDAQNRMNPQNGMCFNGLHDRAFESGLITILPDYTIRVSSQLIKSKSQKNIPEFFSQYEKRSIILPSRFLPEKEFLLHHNDVRFKP